jgi:hypothetical protein
MNNQPWIVKKHSGETWGRIRKVIIDAATRHVVFLDVVLDDTGSLVRVPWINLEINNEDIMLRSLDGEFKATVLADSGDALSDTVTLECQGKRRPPHASVG